MSVLGGIHEVGEDKAKRFGGAGNYFGRKLPSILRETGANTCEFFLGWYKIE